jgi:acyl-CoA synthetase
MRPFLTLHHPATSRHYYAAGTWRDETFFDLLARHAQSRPDSPCARDGGRILSWGAMLSWVEGIASQLAELGLAGGDSVSIWMGNRLEAVAVFLACARQGFACNPSLHRTYTCAEIAELLDRLATRVLVTEPGWGADRTEERFQAAMARVATLKAILAPASLAGPSPPPGPPVRDPDKVAYLAFTSGTTGTPKCVMHSDNTLLANARDLVRDWGHGPDTILLTLSPLSHHIAWVAVAQWLLAGCMLVTDDRPAGVSRLDWILRSGATYVMGVPTHALDVLQEQRRRGLERLGAVRVFYMAGSPIPPAAAEAFVAQGIRPQNVYGMTENSSHQYTHPDDDTATIIATCGRGGPAYEVRIFDPADRDRAVPLGTAGEIGGRGAALMLGYFDNQAATESSFNRDGWFMSGDLGVLGEAGNLRIEGRLKDLIIRGGHNIYPAQIEAIAIRHPAVSRVAAFPIADERLGEMVCLAVIGEVEAEAMLTFLREQGLSRYDMPEWFVRLAGFPLTASGKVLKRELVAMVKRGEIAPVPVRYANRETA